MPNKNIDNKRDAGPSKSALIITQITSIVIIKKTKTYKNRQRYHKLHYDTDRSTTRYHKPDYDTASLRFGPLRLE
jgi:hypothetical protein